MRDEEKIKIKRQIQQDACVMNSEQLLRSNR